MSSTLPTDDSAFSANRRAFLSRAFALSSAAVASGVITHEVSAAQNKAPNDNTRCAPEAIRIQSETGETFEGVVVPGSISERLDPKLGRIVQLEVVFNSFSHRSVSVKKVTDQVEKLALVHQELHRPPVALLTIGNDNGGFTGGVVNATSAFTLFLDDGTPVRAHMLLDIALLS